MPPEWGVDVRPLIKEGVQAVIERHSDVDVDPPTRTFHQLSTGGFMQNTEEVTVPVPGDFFDDKDVFDNLYAGEFAEAAQLIYDQLPDPPDDDQLPEANRIESIERGLLE